MKPWLATVVIGALIAVAPPASATKPDRTPEPPADVTFPAGFGCPDFDVHLVTEARGWVKVFANGEIQSSGYERAWVTNVSTQRQLELIVNGRVHIVLPNGGEGELVITGPQLIIFFPGDDGPGDTSQSRMWYFKGQVRATVDDIFTFLTFESTGTSFDVCAALS